MLNSHQNVPHILFVRIDAAITEKSICHYYIRQLRITAKIKCTDRCFQGQKYLEDHS